MRRSVRLLLFGVAAPAAASSLVYGMLFSENDVHRHVVVDVSSPVSAVAPRVSGSCEYERIDVQDVSATASDVLHVRSGSGGLHVEGRPGEGDVTVTARMCASDPDLLDDLGVGVDARGGDVRVETSYPRTSGHGRYARIELEVVVPLGMDAVVDDGSGGMTLVQLGDVRVEDGSGGIEVWGANGSVDIDDGSGSIMLTDIGGDVNVHDGSGSIEIRDVQGSVEIVDGSGSIDVFDVTSDVRLEDGSGSIDVTEVGGDFRVLRDGSGSIRYARIDGRVEVPRRHRDGN